MTAWQQRAIKRAAACWVRHQPHEAVTILQAAGLTQSEVNDIVRVWTRRASEAFRSAMVESIRQSRPDRRTHRARQSKRTAKRT